MSEPPKEALPDKPESRSVGAEVQMSEAQQVKPYSFSFDKAKNTWVCSIHGEVECTAWIPCWNGCDEGYFDAYEEDPLWYDEGEMEKCSACGGNGGFTVCGECNMRNPDAEF